LGLSIVTAIATAHNGTLALRAREHGGLRVLIDLPGTPKVNSAATTTGSLPAIPQDRLR